MYGGGRISDSKNRRDGEGGVSGDSSLTRCLLVVVDGWFLSVLVGGVDDKPLLILERGLDQLVPRCYRFLDIPSI